MGDRERHGQVRQRHPRLLLGQGDELFHGVQPAFVAEALEAERGTADCRPGGPCGSGWLTGRPRAGCTPGRPCRSARRRQHLALDAAVEDRVRPPAVPITVAGDPLRLDDVRGGKEEAPMAWILPARTRSVRAERVSSTSVSGRLGGSGTGRRGRYRAGAASSPARGPASAARRPCGSGLSPMAGGPRRRVPRRPAALEGLADDFLGLAA